MGSNTNSVWTEALVETLKKHWDDGYTCSQIADELGRGITRNAVIGKVSRLGLEKRHWGNGYSRLIDPTPADTPRRPTQRVRRVRIPAPPPKIITAVSPITGAYINFKRPRLNRQLTKSELRAMLTTAVQNTAALGVS